MPSNGKVALVTGAGSGIGRAVCLAFQSVGYSVVLAGRRLVELEKTVALAAPGKGKMVAVRTDVGRPDSVQAAFAETKEVFGRLDILFNNAGINAPSVPLEDLTYEQWTQVLDINLTGAFLCAQAAFKLIKTQHAPGGRIINNGSISAHASRTSP